MKRGNWKNIAAALVISLAGGAPLATAGDLTPPPGPILPTNKVQINQQRIAAFPYTISQPGSYVLTSDIVGVAGQHGIVVTAEGVTIDLNGFSLTGVAGSLNGVQISANRVEVRNGAVSTWGQHGISSGSAGLVFEGLRLNDNGLRGINAGNNAIIRDCSAMGNGELGLRVGAGSQVANCVARLNAGVGILALTGATIVDCNTLENTSTGISVQTGSSVTNCTSRFDGGNGITTGDHSRITACTVTQAAMIGIGAGTVTNISNCTVRGSGDVGIRAGGGSVIDSCSVATSGTDGVQLFNDEHVVVNTSSNNNAGDGIVVGRRARVSGCTASRNANGVVTGVGAVVTETTAADNATVGFVVFPGGTVLNCNSQDNGSHGFELGRAQVGQTVSMHAVTVTGSTASSNGGHGFFAFNINGPALFTSCNAFKNTLNGFEAFGTYQSCQASLNLVNGFNISHGSAIHNSTANANVGVGIMGGQGVTVAGCTARANQGLAGISIDEGIVRDCTASANARHGISANRQAQILNNMCGQNGVGPTVNDGAGIILTAQFGGTGSRVDGNNVTFNDVGIRSVGGGNHIVRNTASGNTANFSLAGGNNVGPIQIGVVGAASGGPWDNMSF